MKHTESYIDDSIKDPEHLPTDVQGILNDLKEYDQNGKWWLYYDRLDDLCVVTKNAMAANAMTQIAWEIIVKKYWVHADKIYNKECEVEKNETSEFINNS